MLECCLEPSRYVNNQRRAVCRPGHLEEGIDCRAPLLGQRLDATLGRTPRTFGLEISTWRALFCLDQAHDSVLHLITPPSREISLKQAELMNMIYGICMGAFPSTSEREIGRESSCPARHWGTLVTVVLSLFEGGKVPDPTRPSRLTSRICSKTSRHTRYTSKTLCGGTYSAFAEHMSVSQVDMYLHSQGYARVGRTAPMGMKKTGRNPEADRRRRRSEYLSVLQGLDGGRRGFNSLRR